MQNQILENKDPVPTGEVKINVEEGERMKIHADKPELFFYIYKRLTRLNPKVQHDRYDKTETSVTLNVGYADNFNDLADSIVEDNLAPGSPRDRAALIAQQFRNFRLQLG